MSISEYENVRYMKMAKMQSRVLMMDEFLWTSSEVWTREVYYHVCMCVQSVRHVLNSFVGVCVPCKLYARPLVLRLNQSPLTTEWSTVSWSTVALLSVRIV